MTRAQLADVTLKALWNRERLGDDFLDEVRDWLLSAGWALFYAGPVFGAVRIDAVRNWPSVAAKRIAPILAQVNEGGFDFRKLEELLPTTERPGQEADENDDQ